MSSRHSTKSPVSKKTPHLSPTATSPPATSGSLKSPGGSSIISTRSSAKYVTGLLCLHLVQLLKPGHWFKRGASNQCQFLEKFCWLSFIHSCHFNSISYSRKMKQNKRIKTAAAPPTTLFLDSYEQFSHMTCPVRLYPFCCWFFICLILGKGLSKRRSI